MTVMRKEDEVNEYPSRNNRLQLSLSLDNSGKGNALSNVIKQDSAVTDSVYPIKRKVSSPLPKNLKKLNFGNMFNGYRNDNDNDSVPVATLSNMGNTCYLNSVLYTLRFTPSFLHNLHHLVLDLTSIHNKLNQTKAKSSSLGRNIPGIAGPYNRSSSSKDLFSLNSLNDLYPKSKNQIMTEKLHELFVQLHSLEMKENNDPYQPSNFLQALIDINSLYSGNQQQDAHELLVNLLDILQETCDLLKSEPLEIDDAKTWSGKRKKKKEKKEVIINGSNNESDEQSSSENSVEKIIKNFISDNFSGVTLLRTKCIECESITERKEPFLDIRVPIPLTDTDLENQHISDIYRSFCVTSENLRDTNKYWCEQCVRYNEACNEVSYERLPNLLVLQLKRFSQSANGTEKINSYMPTPLILECFCNDCRLKNDAKAIHSYQLYSVIMHLGATMASGHYIAYTRASDYYNDYLECSRENPNKSTFSSGELSKTINFLKLFKPKSDNIKNSTLPTLCRSKDCCGVKLSKSVIENVMNSTNRCKNSKFYDDNKDGGSLWLECDDDVVRTMSTDEFQNLLSCKKNSSATPYLLFYSKINESFCNTNSSNE